MPISNGDGRATIIPLGGAQSIVAGTFTEILPLTYGQVIPRPFCSTGPLDYVLVTGPVSLEKTVAVGADGSYSSSFEASVIVCSVEGLSPVRATKARTSSGDSCANIAFPTPVL